MENEYNNQDNKLINEDDDYINPKCTFDGHHTVYDISTQFSFHGYLNGSGKYNDYSNYKTTQYEKYFLIA